MNPRSIVAALDALDGCGTDPGMLLYLEIRAEDFQPSRIEISLALH